MSKKIISEQNLNVGSATIIGGGNSSVGKQNENPGSKRNIGQSGEDFPFIDDTEYITHRDYRELGGRYSNSALEWLMVLEQDIEPAEKPDETEEGGEEEFLPPTEEPPNMMQPGMGPVFSSNEIGRIYELKKIYSRLMTIETFLGEETSAELNKIRVLVSKAIDLFETLISNIQMFKDKLDEIIVNYYKFIDQILVELRTYYKNRKEINYSKNNEVKKYE